MKLVYDLDDNKKRVQVLYMSIYEYGVLQIALLIYFSVFIFDKKEKDRKTFYIICVINIFLLLSLNSNINIFEYFSKNILKLIR